MTKRKDKKAPIKISAAAQLAEEKKSVKEDETLKQEVVIEEAKADVNADEIIVEDAVQSKQVAETKAEDLVETKDNEKGNKEDKSDKESKKDDKNKKDDKSKKSKKEKKDRKGLKRRTKETVSELKKVVWPKFPEVVKRTGVVLAFVVIFAVVLLGLDLLFGFLSSALMGNPFIPFK